MYTGVEVFYNQYFGAGTGPIVYTYLRCDGTESRLENCRTSNSFYFSASHSNDAGVRCQRPVTTGKIYNISFSNHNYKFLQPDPVV